ncbi:MAG: putative membrane protein [Planctomycetota bacterium]|jgi:uncharacterized membrane protein
MEQLLLLFAFLITATWVIAVPVMSIVALLRTRKLERRVGKLEQELRDARSSEPIAPIPPRPAKAPVRIERPETSSARPRAQAPTPKPSVPAAPVQQRPAASKAKRASTIEWEQWIGIRGAAALGGLLFALAGLLFFQHAVANDWLNANMRVASGATVGLLALAVGEFFQRRLYRFAPSASVGAGVVILFATTWASYQLYDFIPVLVALPLMAIITALCGVFSIRFNSLFVAVLGLLGGFATPLLLSIQPENPIGLFGYLLLLDLGLLALGKRMKWSMLSILGVLGSYGVMLAWVFLQEGPQSHPVILMGLGAFALLFIAAGQRSPIKAGSSSFASQAGALLLPFAFVLNFASYTDLGDKLWPMALLAGFLAVAANWVGSRQGAKWLPVGVGAGTLALVGLWLERTGVSHGTLWEFCGSTVGLGVVFLVADRVFFGEHAVQKTSVEAPAIVSVGFALMTSAAALFYLDTSPWPWLVSALGHTFCLHWLGRRVGLGALRVVGSLCASLTLGLHVMDIAGTSLSGVPGPAVTLSWIAGACSGMLALAVVAEKLEGSARSKWAWHAAALFPLGLLILPPVMGAHLSSALLPALLMPALLAGFVVAAAVRRGWGAWYFIAGATFLARRAEWILYSTDVAGPLDEAGALLSLELFAYILLVATPLVFHKSLGASRLAWASVAVFLCFSLSALNQLFGAHFASDAQWPSAALLGGIALALGSIAKERLTAENSSRHDAIRWTFSAASLLTSLAVAQLVGHHVALVFFALSALGLAAVWRMQPARPLKWACAILMGLGASTLLLRVLQTVAEEALVFPNSDLLVWNWTSYACAVPALCALAAAILIGDGKRTMGFLGLASAGFAFVWLNLQVFLYFEQAEYLKLSFKHLPARDLVLSICWILYALSLLAAGMAGKIKGLRQLSLAFLLLTLAKVFLYDLGDLSGLYRIGSLAGLAVSLLLVSLVYQRFVFPRQSPPIDE